jgi:hypothetical protein
LKQEEATLPPVDFVQAHGAGHAVQSRCLLPSFSDWEFTVDRIATDAAYARAERGGSDECTCSGCRNFVAVRDKVYPSTFGTFLKFLGMDSRKRRRGVPQRSARPGAPRRRMVSLRRISGEDWRLPGCSHGRRFCSVVAAEKRAELESLKGREPFRLNSMLRQCRGSWMSPSWNEEPSRPFRGLTAIRSAERRAWNRV